MLEGENSITFITVLNQQINKLSSLAITHCYLNKASFLIKKKKKKRKETKDFQTQVKSPVLYIPGQFCGTNDPTKLLKCLPCNIRSRRRFAHVIDSSLL